MSFIPTVPDRVYRRRDRFVVIATLESLAPKDDTLPPRYFGGGNGDLTWFHVQQFFATRFPPTRLGLPLAREFQLPMHYYSEYVGVQYSDDYFVYVGEPETNRSWWLEQAARSGAIPIEYLDGVLVVIQENYGVEVVERRIFEVLADRVLTPIQRRWGIGNDNIVFFEKIANRAVVTAREWPYRFREPTFLDTSVLELYLQKYQKR